MSEEFMEEIGRSFIEDGDPEPVHIRLAKAEQRIRELEAANRLLRKQRGAAAEETEIGKLEKRITRLEKFALALVHHEHNQTRGLETRGMNVPYGPLSECLSKIKKDLDKKTELLAREVEEDE